MKLSICLYRLQDIRLQRQFYDKTEMTNFIVMTVYATQLSVNKLFMKWLKQIINLMSRDLYNLHSMFEQHQPELLCKPNSFSYIGIEIICFIGLHPYYHVNTSFSFQWSLKFWNHDTEIFKEMKNPLKYLTYAPHTFSVQALK